jgi:hypothetical protein
VNFVPLSFTPLSFAPLSLAPLSPHPKLIFVSMGRSLKVLLPLLTNVSLGWGDICANDSGANDRGVNDRGTKFVDSINAFWGISRIFSIENIPT